MRSRNSSCDMSEVGNKHSSANAIAAFVRGECSQQCCKWTNWRVSCQELHLQHCCEHSPLTNAAMALSRSVCYQRHNVSHITRRAVTMHLAHGLDKVHTSTGGVTISPGPAATTSWCKCPAPYREKRTQLKWRSHALMRSHISRDRPRDERTHCT